MVYKHAYLNKLLLLHFAFMLSMVKMSLKGDGGSHALNSHENYIVDHGKSWNCVLNFCGNLTWVTKDDSYLETCGYLRNFCSYSY